MPVVITYRGAGAWGPGQGSNLSAAQMDTNFYALTQAVDALQTSPVQPNQIVSVSESNQSITFHLQDGSTLGPIPMPVLQFRWRGEWQPDTDYLALDTFTVAASGIFSVMYDYTSGATFDPNVEDSNGLILNQLFGATGTQLLSQLQDVEISSIAEGDILRWIEESTGGRWENARQKYIIGANLNGVFTSSQDLFHHTFACGVTFPANFADYLEYSSRAGATAVATGTTVLTVSLCPAGSDPTNNSNYATIGTITYSASGSSGALATSSGLVKYASKGDVLRIQGPSSADATLAGVFVTLVGYES